MKYEMLGACLDYHRPLHLTHHYTLLTAERKGIHHGDLTRNMKNGLFSSPPLLWYCWRLSEVICELHISTYTDLPAVETLYL